MTPEIDERITAFLDYAECQLLRGNFDAVREAHEDAKRLMAQCGLHVDEVLW